MVAHFDYLASIRSWYLRRRFKRSRLKLIPTLLRSTCWEVYVSSTLVLRASFSVASSQLQVLRDSFIVALVASSSWSWTKSVNAILGHPPTKKLLLLTSINNHLQWKLLKKINHHSSKQTSLYQTNNIILEKICKTNHCY